MAEQVTQRGEYSLRRFAKKLGVSSSHLSEVMSSKKHLSVEVAQKLAFKLGLNERESLYFTLLAQQETEKDPESRALIRQRLAQTNPQRRILNLASQDFAAIADWHHFAILELTYIAGLKITPIQVARALGIAPPEAKLAIERLLEMGLLAKERSGLIKKSANQILTRSKSANLGIRRFHKQLLNKALDALDAQSPSQRWSGSDLIPIDSRTIPEIRRLLEQLSSELIRISERSKRKDALYCLATHFFEVTKKQGETL